MHSLRNTAIALLLSFGVPAAAKPGEAVTPFLPIQNEAHPRLYVEPPLPGPLTDRGAVIIPYRTENFRILPVFGASSVNVSPRAGHLHVTVDDLPWHWADAGDNHTVVVVGLPAGPHKVLIELAAPEHNVVIGQAIKFVVPKLSGPAH